MSTTARTLKAPKGRAITLDQLRTFVAATDPRADGTDVRARVSITGRLIEVSVEEPTDG